MRRRVPALVALALLMLLATAALAHAAPVPPYDKAECFECHAVGGLGRPTDDFNVTQLVNRKATCVICHGDPRLTADALSHQHMQEGCDDDGCHDGWTVFSFSVPGGRFTENMLTWATGYGYFHTSSSQYANSSALHRAHGQQWVPTTFAQYNPVCASQCHVPSGCKSCHTGTIAHESHGDPAGLPRDCTVSGCHELRFAGTTAFVPTCESCHARNVGDHGYDAAAHTAAVASDVEGVSGNVCGDCHSMDLLTEHARTTSSSHGRSCATCHPNPRSSFTTWGGTCQQGGCHTDGGPTQAHAGESASHSTAEGEAGVCGGCHEGDLATVHDGAVSEEDESRTWCLVCHSTTELP